MTYHSKYITVFLFLLISCFTCIQAPAQWSIPIFSYESECLISYADYSPDGRYIAGCCSNNSIVIWNTETGSVYRTLTGLKKNTNAVCFNNTGEILYGAAENGSVCKWDPGKLLLMKTIKGHQGAINAIAISPDGKFLATGGNDKVIRIWNADSLTLFRELKSHTKLITSLNFSHDGKKLVSGSADMTLCMWETRTGKGLNMTQAHDGWVRAVVFSPDDKIIASCGDDNKIFLWNSSDISRITSLNEHTNWVQTLDFSNDGKSLISGGHDKQIILWNIAKKEEIILQKGLENIILNARFSPDGKSILSTQLLTNKVDIWENIVTAPESLAEKPADEPVKEIRDEESSPEIKEKPAEQEYPLISVYSPELKTGKTITENAEVVILGKVSDPNGVSAVLLNKAPVMITNDGIFEHTVSLHKGINNIEILAVNQAGTLRRDHFVIDCLADIGSDDATYMPKVHAGKYYALIIAVNEYDDPNILDLDMPLKDARELHQILIDKYIFSPENITFLRNPSRVEIIMALDELSKTVTEKDNLLIFYAGHGYWDDKGKIGYWLPRDAMKSNTANWVRNSTMRDFIGSIKSKHTILIADACFSGSIFKTRKAFSEPPEGISKLHSLSSRKAMTSGTLELVPDESVFLRYLIKRLAENDQKYLPSETLFSNLKPAVLNNSPNIPQYGTIQNVGDEGGDFIFILR